jgi:hypothetical protein
MDDSTEAPLSLQNQTIELGKMLKTISDADPSGTPTETAASAFTSWMTEAGPDSRQPDYFTDVLENYIIVDNSNKDLWDLFDMLENYIEVEDEEWEEDAPRKTFIGLPLIGEG